MCTIMKGTVVSQAFKRRVESGAPQDERGEKRAVEILYSRSCRLAFGDMGIADCRKDRLKLFTSTQRCWIGRSNESNLVIVLVRACRRKTDVSGSPPWPL